jgi:hypothetical protein
VLSGWAQAPEVGPGVWKKTNIGFDVRELTIDNMRVIGIHKDRMLVGGEGFDTLTIPAYKDLEQVGFQTIKWWNGIEAIWGNSDDTGILYIRFRNGDDPNGKNILVYPNGYSMFNAINPAVNLYYRSNIIIWTIMGTIVLGLGGMGQTQYTQ